MTTQTPEQLVEQLRANLDLMSTELRVCKEQRDILRKAVTFLREFVAEVGKSASPGFAEPVLARIDSVIRLTAP